jgi:DNA-binding CsgD family transcriptional regulator
MKGVTRQEYRRMLGVATALLEGIGTGTPRESVRAVLTECFQCVATVHIEGAPAPTGTTGADVWRPGRHEDVPRAATVLVAMPCTTGMLLLGDVDGVRDWRDNACGRDVDENPCHLTIALPADVELSGVLICCRPGRPFDARDREVARRLQPLLTSVQRHLAHRRRPAPCLTGRELAVLASMADGLTAAAAGRRLGISARTFEKHLERLYRKFDTHDRVHTVLLAQDLGVLPQRW